MRKFSARSSCYLTAIGVFTSLAPALSLADGTSDDWSFAATIYLWLPSMSGDISFPVGPGGGGGGGSSADVSASDILNALEFGFLGAFNAQKGRWGVFTDLNYLDLGDSKKATRDLTVGGNDLPANATAKVDMGVQGWIWTTAGTYRAVDQPSYSLDLLAGARMLDLSTDLTWHLDGDVSGVPLPGRAGKSDLSENFWDAIVGVRGRANFGDEDRWFVPYYVDVGTGDSDLTWAGMLGLGYSCDWGDLVAVWRYMDWDLPSGDPVQGLSFNGPAFGVTFHF